MDYLSSMYIDNEMDLDEKRLFLERVRSDDAFYTQTVELLDQEQLLRQLPVMPPESSAAAPWRPSVWTVLANWFRPLGFATAGFTAAVLLLFTVFQPSPPTVCNNRFVLFEPAADQVELAGSFTGWQRVSMTRAGTSGYWEVNLQVPSGEHRFAYILDGKRQMADPTLPASEKDDFGGQNSILNVEARL
jgi:hypothetical protein